MLRRAFFAAVLLASLSACGFHLRGPQTLPFATIQLGMNPYEDFTASLKRQIATSGSTKVVEQLTEADVSLQVVSNDKEKYILSLNASGAVREYQLRQRFAFRLVDKGGREVISHSEIYVYRDVSFSEGQELAKAQEDTLLYRDMENDIVQQLMRRLSRARLPAAQ
jgi:LPS-assembly lipoprotein